MGMRCGEGSRWLEMQSSHTAAAVLILSYSYVRVVTTIPSLRCTLYSVPAVRLEMTIVAALAAVEAALVASPAVFTSAALGVDALAARTE